MKRLLLAVLLAVLAPAAFADPQRPVVLKNGQMQPVASGDTLQVPAVDGATPYGDLNANQFGLSMNVGGCEAGDYEGYQSPNTIVAGVVGCVATPAGRFRGTVSWPDSGVAGFAATLNPTKSAVGVTGSAGSGVANAYVYGGNFSGVNCRLYAPSCTYGTGFDMINETGVEFDVGVYSTPRGPPTGRFTGVDIQVNTDKGVGPRSVLDGVDLVGNSSLRHGFLIGYATENGSAETGLLLAADSFAPTAPSQSINLQALVLGVAASSTLLTDTAKTLQIKGVAGITLTSPRNVLTGPTEIAGGALRLQPQTFAALPACNDGAKGTLAFITDAREPIAAWHQTVSAGGGGNPAFIACDGAAWHAFDY